MIFTQESLVTSAKPLDLALLSHIFQMWWQISINYKAISSRCRYEAYFSLTCKNTENIVRIPIPRNVAGGLVKQKEKS